MDMNREQASFYSSFINYEEHPEKSNKSLRSYIANGGDANFRLSQENVTVLMMMCKYSNVDLVKLLLENRANPNLQNINGNVALHYLMHSLEKKSFEKDNEILDLLLRYGADINMVDQYNDSSLHIACRLGNIKMIEALLRRGADQNLKNIPADKTPVEVFLGNNKNDRGLWENNKIINLFRKYKDQQERLNRLPPPYKSPAQIAQEKIDRFEIKELLQTPNWFKTSQGNISEEKFINEIINSFTSPSTLDTVSQYLSSGGDPDSPFPINYDNPTGLSWLASRLCVGNNGFAQMTQTLR